LLVVPNTGAATASGALVATVLAILRISPALGPAGFLPDAIGIGFAPGIPVLLRWVDHRGVTVAIPGPDGSFVMPVLRFRKDEIGLRQLEASVRSFGTVRLDRPYLVVPSQPAPPKLVTRR
jgi:hypothetical protein